MSFGRLGSLGAGFGRLGGGSGAVNSLPAFTYEQETETLVAAFSTPPTKRRKDTINWAIKTLKESNNGVNSTWDAIQKFAKVGADEQSSLLDWKGGADFVKVGTPTFNANVDWAPGSGNYIRSGVYLDDLSSSSMGIFVYNTTAGGSGVACGANDGSSNGLSIQPKSTTSSRMNARCGGAVVTTIANTTDWDGRKFHMVCRSNGTDFQAYRGPSKKADVSNTPATLGHVEITFLANNNNGTPTTTGATITQQSCFGILNRGLTEAEASVLANVVHQLVFEFQYGEYDTYAPRVAPASVSADLIVFGETGQGKLAAYEAARRGLDVVIVSGWRIQHGMSAGGLGYADFNAPAQLGGLPRWVLTQIQSIMGTTSTDFGFQPRHFDRVVRGLFDPRITNGLDIPIYYSEGIASVQKSGARIAGFTTVDGRTFTAPYFIDASYEGDLMRLTSGITTRYGRESSAEFSETVAGYRGVLTSSGSDRAQFKDAGDNNINIDPYVTPGDSGSGTLPFISGTYVSGSPANGSADTKIQAYNFRITTCTDPAYRMPFPTTPPPGYDVAYWEPLLRNFDADPTLTLGDVIKADQIGNSSNGSGAVYDINARPGQTADFWHPTLGSSNFPTASYADRETIWQAHINHILGLWYLLQHDPDPRVPAAVRTSALNHGLHWEHYNRITKAGDPYNFPPNLYIRECFRLDNDFMMRYSDFFQTDDTDPRSTKTVAMASYALDSHPIQALADPNGGTPRIWLEGGFVVDLSGNQYVPVPYEAITPRKAECENLLVPFAMAATHAAFGSLRMEFTSMQAAQSAAVAIDIAIGEGNIAVQDVDYSDLRTALLASNTLTDETAPVLTQTN